MRVPKGVGIMKVQVGKRYKTRGYAPVDLFGFVPGQRIYTVLRNTEQWCDHLEFVCVDERGYKVCTCDEQGRVYPDNLWPGHLGSESSFDLIEEVED